LLAADGASLRGKCDYVNLAILLGCGLRRAELTSLRVENVQFPCIGLRPRFTCSEVIRVRDLSAVKWPSLPAAETNGMINGQVRALDSLRDMLGFISPLVAAQMPPEELYV
jgi:hypothetical protein